jgi:hypothetical protein
MLHTKGIIGNKKIAAEIGFKPATSGQGAVLPEMAAVSLSPPF